MRVNRSTQYGLLAACYVAEHQEKTLVLSQDIAKEYNIPLEYLLKILQQFVKANILRSKRGPRGGFSLAKSPKKITLLEIIEAVEGPTVSPLDLIDYARGEKSSARADQICKKAIAQARSVFEKAKLSDLLTG